MTPRLFRQRAGVGRRRSPYVSSKAGNQSFDCWSVWRSMLHRKPRWYLQTLPVHCEAAHPGTTICSNGLPLMDVDALRTGLHAAAPMRPANSHVKVSVRTVQSTVSVTTPVNGYGENPPYGILEGEGETRSSIEPSEQPLPTRQGNPGEIRYQFIILARKDELTSTEARERCVGLSAISSLLQKGDSRGMRLCHPSYPRPKGTRNHSMAEKRGYVEIGETGPRKTRVASSRTTA